eukprot:s1341_g28.t1
MLAGDLMEEPDLPKECHSCLPCLPGSIVFCVGLLGPRYMKSWRVLLVLAVDLVYVSALKSTDLLQRWLPKMGIDEALRLRGQLEFPDQRKEDKEDKKGQGATWADAHALNLVNDLVNDLVNLRQTMDLLEILCDALLPFLLPSDMTRFTTTSLQVAQALPLVARRKAAAERPSEGWHLVNYVPSSARYAEPKEQILTCAKLRLFRKVLCTFQKQLSTCDTLSAQEFTGMALGAALEAAGRLQPLDTLNIRQGGSTRHLEASPRPPKELPQPGTDAGELQFGMAFGSYHTNETGGKTTISTVPKVPAPRIATLTWPWSTQNVLIAIFVRWRFKAQSTAESSRVQSTEMARYGSPVQRDNSRRVCRPVANGQMAAHRALEIL